MQSVELQQLKGVGEKLEAVLRQLGICTPLDLLFHLPKTYQDRTRILPLNQLKPNTMALIQGEIIQVEVIRARRRTLLCHLKDEKGLITLRFFHFYPAQQSQMKIGRFMRCFGEARLVGMRIEMVHPEYEVFDADAIPPLEPSLTPLYPLTEGLTQKRLRGLIQQAFEILNTVELPELLPASIRQLMKFPTLLEALRFVHFPQKGANVDLLLQGKHPMQQRLAFEELLAHRLSLQRLKRVRQAGLSPVLLKKNHYESAFLKSLPFTPTRSQTRVCQEISADLSKPHAMMRLVQGDVGSGKTFVAMLSALQAVENQIQVAVMAPTEILAEQHYLNFDRYFTPLGISVVWLAGKLTSKQREKVRGEVASGQAQVVVGTQALFQEGVEFKSLGYVIIDEQHRFGVEQRKALQDKGKTSGMIPHQLVMTATPIPRTLAMTAYADLDVSVIDELPPGRTPVKTVLVGDMRRDEVINRIKAACQNGRQAYWVCTLIEESEVLACQAAENTALQLTEQLAPLKVGLIHGRLKSDEKAHVMSCFKAGDIQVLVATTVIEVGVDVPNASLMIIENPERLGLAQLHQLRGRVGRGSIESFCVLLYHMPISTEAMARLAVMRETNDGFLIAEKDLELRGPGEVLGTRQTGAMEFKMADLVRDRHLLPSVQSGADFIFQEAPHHVEPLIHRWIGNRVHYAVV